MLSLTPILVFVLIYLVASIIAGDFYKVPVTAAFLISSVYAVAVCPGTMRHRIKVFSHGAGKADMMLMLWIFVLAGAFAKTAAVIGSIDATVNLTLNLLPPSMLLPGLFIAACFVSLSVGTSVGTIVALTPIAAGLAGVVGMPVEQMAAVIVGGAFFGDNLSFISDTTIVATTSQGCRLNDKFKANLWLAIPAAFAVLIIYVVKGLDGSTAGQTEEIEWIKVIPYLLVLLLAVAGLNVLVVLAIGVVAAGAIGMSLGVFDVYGWFSAIGDGIGSMGELIIVTLLAGGMLETIKRGGGIRLLIDFLTRHIKGKRGAELGLAGLVALVNCCTANNTVAIITVGGIARQISEKFGIDPRKSASILDTMSCCVQGMLPYGAQLLMAGGLAAVSPVAIIPHLYYPFCLGAITIVAILCRYPRRYS